MEDNYFSNQSLSNSAMSALNPEQGGSPAKLLEFFKGDKERKQSLSLERGSLLHLYCENPAEFVVSDIAKPSDNIAACIEYAYSKAFEGKELDPTQVGELLLEKAKQINYGQSWAPTTLLKKVNDGGKEYLGFLIKSHGKIAMTPETKYIVENCIKSLHSNHLADQLLFEDPDVVPSPDIKNFTEQAIYWSEKVTVPGTSISLHIPTKARIDKLRIDFANKIIYIPDIKTTSKGAYGFEESFQYWHYYRQHSFYRRAVQVFMQQKYPDIDLTDFDVKSYNVVVETSGLFQAVVWSVPGTWIRKGREEYQGLLQRYAWHMHYDIWDQSMEEYNNKGLLVLPDPEDTKLS